MKSSKVRKSKSTSGSSTNISEKEICQPCGIQQIMDPKKGGSSGASLNTQESGKEVARMRRKKERLDRLARPSPRMIRALYESRFSQLKCCDREMLKSNVEEQYCLGPEAAENYFKMLARGGPGGVMTKRVFEGNMIDRIDQAERTKLMNQRQKWLVDFSAQVAYQMCEYIDKSPKEVLVSNRLRSIADVVLERVAEVLCEPKPSRSNPGRLPRFMVAISDRIAVWIENAVYRANFNEPHDSNKCDAHFDLDRATVD